MQSKKQNLEKNRRTSLTVYMSVVTLASLYAGLHLGVGQAEKYTELPLEETIDTMISYIRQKRFTKEQLSEVSSTITGATAKKLIEWGMIYEFAS